MTDIPDNAIIIKGGNDMYQEIDENTTMLITLIQNGVPQQHNLQDELAFSEQTFNFDLANQSASYAFWSQVLVSAKSKLEEARLNGQVLHAQIANEARTELSKPSVATVEDYVLAKTEYQQNLQQQLDWQTQVDKLNYIVKSFDQRSNMLSQFGANLRKNLDNIAR